MCFLVGVVVVVVFSFSSLLLSLCFSLDQMETREAGNSKVTSFVFHHERDASSLTRASPASSAIKNYTAQTFFSQRNRKSFRQRLRCVAEKEKRQPVHVA